MQISITLPGDHLCSHSRRSLFLPTRSMWVWVGMMVMGVLISCMAVLLTSLRCNLTASFSFQQGWIAQFRIFFLQAGLVFDAMTRVAQCFWIATLRIVPTCRPRRASRTRSACRALLVRAAAVPPEPL